MFFLFYVFFWLTLILIFHSNVILIDRGSRLLHPGRQEPRGPHRGGEDCSARPTLPWKQHKASDQNQGIKGIQGAVTCDWHSSIYLNPLISAELG